MRRVNRRRITTPTELLSPACSNHLNQIISNPRTKAISNLYRGLVIDPAGVKRFTVVEALKGIYHNKCSYCEKFAHDPKIDHHRPKGRVVGEPKTNKGYYWLSYEWTNLLPTCTNCNELGAKGSKYPLNGPRNNSHPTNGAPPALNVQDLAYTSKFNLREVPQVLHPEFCYPHRHFDFDRNGLIVGLTNEGAKTIEIIGLDNEDLNGWRRKIYNNYNDDLAKIILRHFRPNNPISDDDFKEQIKEWVLNLVTDSLNIYDEYTLFKKKLIEKLDYFFIDPVDDVYKPKLTVEVIEALRSI